MTPTAPLAGPAAAAHLRPEILATAHRHLVAKTLAELSHERLLAPVRLDDAPTAGALGTSGTVPYRLVLDDGRVVYRFRARRTALEHWVLDEASITRDLDGSPAPLDALDLVLELQPDLRVPDDLLPLYLEELSSTLASAAFKIHRGGPSARELVDADLATVEQAMTEGHPGFIANNGRIGFGVAEHAAYSPEAAAPVRVVWLAARRASTCLSLGAGLDEAAFYRAELGDVMLARFEATLRARGSILPGTSTCRSTRGSGSTVSR